MGRLSARRGQSTDRRPTGTGTPSRQWPPPALWRPRSNVTAVSDRSRRRQRGRVGKPANAPLQRRRAQDDLHVVRVEATAEAADRDLAVRADDEIKVLVAVDVDRDRACREEGGAGGSTSKCAVSSRAPRRADDLPASDGRRSGAGRNAPPSTSPVTTSCHRMSSNERTAVRRCERASAEASLGLPAPPA